MLSVPMPLVHTVPTYNNALSNFTIDASNHYLYFHYSANWAIATLVQYYEAADYDQITAYGGPASEVARGGYWAPTFTTGALSAYNKSAPLTIGNLDSPSNTNHYNIFAICGDAVESFWAYNSAKENTTTFCGDSGPDPGLILYWTAIFVTSPTVQTSSTTQTTSSTTQTTSPTPKTTSAVGSSAVMPLNPSTSAGVCSVTVALRTEKTTVMTPPGFTAPNASSATSTAPVSVVDGSTYGCVPVTTLAS